MANVCETCGDEGWVEALVFCDSCKLGAVHRYCCGITPVPIDGYVTWFCCDCDESDSAASDSRQVELEEVESVDVSSSPPVIQTMEEPETREIISGSSKSNELTESVSEAGDGASLLEMIENEKKKKKKKKKKKRKIITHSLPDATIVETMEVSKKQDGSENRESDGLVGLGRNESSVSEKSGKKKKKKKKKTDKGEGSNHISPALEAEGHELLATTSVEPMKESKKRKYSESKESEELNVVSEENEKKTKKNKKNEESSTHTLPALDAEDHVLQDVTSVQAMKESTMPKSSESRESKELNVLVGSEPSVLDKNAKKKKKKKRNEENSNHTSPVLKAVDRGHQDTTSVEAIKESKKHKKSDELIGGKSEKKKKKTNEESSNHTAPVLAAKDNVAYDPENVEPAKAQESSASRKPHELAGLETNGASVSEGGNSTNVPCTTSKKRRLTSGNTQATSENMELLPAKNSSCKESESNMPQTNELMQTLNIGGAQPIRTPVWRGSVTVKQGSSCSIHGLVAHLSTLACGTAYEKAGSLRTRLSAEMFPRLEIWPPTFFKHGPPTDGDIALYFFPSCDSDGEKVYYSLVDEMKKKDLAMRCLLEDVELLLFTSYQLPLPFWKFHSKEYLWGTFRRRKTSY